MTKRLSTLTAATLAALALAGVASAFSPDEPGKLAQAALQAQILGQYGRQWQILHPRQRAAFRRAAWERCQRRSHATDVALNMQPDDVRVVDEYDDVVTFPLLGRQKVRAVTLQVALGKRKIADTVYTGRYRGKWYGLIAGDHFRAYRAGRCPA
jgi:hypothetical protein